MCDKLVVFPALFAVLLMARAYGAEPQGIPISQLGRSYQLVGSLGVPMGKSVVVEGVVVNGPSKGFGGGPNILVRRINGEATQKNIQICLEPYFSDWGSDKLPKLSNNQTYSMEGYSAGRYIGNPREAYDRAGIQFQTSDFFFMETFVVYRAEKISKIVFQPSDFSGEQALFEGTAESSSGMSLMRGDGWTVVVAPDKPWPKDVAGRMVETFGCYAPAEDKTKFVLSGGNWRMTKLGEQLGRRVELRGTAWRLRGVWLFNYRGTDLYVENMDSLPGWNDAKCNSKPIVIRGRLEKAYMPSIDQTSQKDKGELNEYYIVRQAEWEPLDELLTPELSQTKH